MDLTCFCPECGAYVSPFFKSCPSCLNWTRPGHELLPEPEAPYWKFDLQQSAKGEPIVAGDLVIFSSGSRELGNGCVYALDKITGLEKWKFQTQFPIESKSVLSDNFLVIGTAGLFRSGGKLYCLDVKDGRVIWKQDLPGAIRAPAVIIEKSLVIITTDTGDVYAFSLLNGRLLPNYPIKIVRGVNGCVLFQRQLFITCENGDIICIDPIKGTSINTHKSDISGRITNLPLLNQQSIYFCLEGGKIASFDLNKHTFEIISHGHKKVTAPVFIKDNVLLVGDWNHKFTAYDIETKKENWSQLFEHSVTTAPSIGNGMVYVGVNDGFMYALDFYTGEIKWKFLIEKHQDDDPTPMPGSPIFDRNLVYFGASNHYAYALPWHLGKFELAGNIMDKMGNFIEAANYYSIAASKENIDDQIKEQFHKNAIERWCQSGFPEKAANYHASILGEDPSLIAKEFQRAGKMLATRKQELAANMLRKAVEIFEDLEDYKSVSECERMAAQIASAPYVTISLRTLPTTWEAGRTHKVAIDLKNRGNSTANEIIVNLTGTFEHPVNLKFEKIPSTETAHIEAPLIPVSAGNGLIRVDVRYTDALGNKWSSSKQLNIIIQNPPPSVIVEGSVGAAQSIAQNIVIKGNVGLLKNKSFINEEVPVIEEGIITTNQQQIKCPSCGYDNSDGDNFCVNCGNNLQK